MGTRLKQLLEPVKRWWLELRSWQKLIAAAALVALPVVCLWAYLAGAPQGGALEQAKPERGPSSSSYAEPYSPDAHKQGELKKSKGFALLESYAGEQERLLRDLEERLASTLTRLARVKEARVHISMPARAPFAKDTAQAKAVVVAWREEGAQLASTDINAIAALACSSVDNLVPRSLKIIDAYSNITYRMSDEGESFVPDDPEWEIKLCRERYQKEVKEILGPWKDAAAVSVACRPAPEEGNNSAAAVAQQSTTSAHRNYIVPISAAVSLTADKLPSGNRTDSVSGDYLQRFKQQWSKHIACALGIPSREVSITFISARNPRAGPTEIPKPWGLVLGMVIAGLATMALGAYLLKQRKVRLSEVKTGRHATAEASAPPPSKGAAHKTLPQAEMLSSIVKADELKPLEPERIFARLRDEHPETVAFVLGGLPRGPAWQVLQMFESNRQKDILGRMFRPEEEGTTPAGETHLAATGELAT